jgi:hypothetical protein
MLWQTRTQRRRERHEDSHLCFKMMSLSASIFVTLIVILAMLVGERADMPLLPYLVDLGAEGLFICSLLLGFLTILGHSILAVIWSMKDLWRSFLVQLLHARRVPASHIRVPAEKWWHLLLSGRGMAARLASCPAIQHTLLRPKINTPFLLFQQAPLLVAP